MKIFYSDKWHYPLPDNHRFPYEKYRLLRERVTQLQRQYDFALLPAPAVTDEELLRAHSAGYVERFRNGTLTDREVREIGLPWSLEYVERARRSAGATVAAAFAALEDGVGVSLASGTHHASAEKGGGFCVFNDSVIAARALQAEGRVRNVLVIDTDVHQGNGTAAITQNDSTIYTFSIHGEKNFPFRKVPSNLDIGLPTGTGDMAYLGALQGGLDQVFAEFSPHLVLWIAGADPYENDRLGKLSLTMNGLAARDEMVIQTCLRHKLPMVVTMGGGYAPKIEESVAVSFQTVAALIQTFATTLE